MSSPVAWLAALVLLVYVPRAMTAGVVHVDLVRLDDNITTPFTDRSLPRIARLCLRPQLLATSPIETKSCLGRAIVHLPSGAVSEVSVDVHFTHEWTPRLNVVLEVRYDVHGTADLDDFDAIADIGPVATQTIEHSVVVNVGKEETLHRTFHAPGNQETSSTIKLLVTCDADWYGSTCAQFCSPNDNQFGHYTCSSMSGEKTCIEGWSTIDDDEPCVAPICDSQCGGLDNGICIAPNVCSCRSGWRGVDCTECIAYPHCAHGTCSMPGECNCEDAYGGALCSVDLDYCEHHAPCQNGAVCYAGKPCDEAHELCEYRCECARGWTGVDCEVKTQACDDDEPCENGGTCATSKNGTVTCACPKGFEGDLCEVSVENTHMIGRHFRPHHVRATTPSSSTSCRANGTWHGDDDEWATDECQMCTCKLGVTTCTASSCSTKDCRPTSSTPSSSMCPSTQTCLSVVDGDCLTPPCRYPFGQCVGKHVVHAGGRREACRVTLEREERRSVGRAIETNECARFYVLLDWATLPQGTNMKTVCHYLTLTLHTRGLTQYAAFCDVKRNDTSSVHLQVDLVALQSGWPMHGISTSLAAWLMEGRSPFDVLRAVVRVDQRLHLVDDDDAHWSAGGRRFALASTNTPPSSRAIDQSTSSRTFEYACLGVIALLCVVIIVMFARVRTQTSAATAPTTSKKDVAVDMEKACNVYDDFRPPPKEINVSLPPTPRVAHVPHVDVSDDETIYEQVDDLVRQNEANTAKTKHDLVTQYEASV